MPYLIDTNIAIHLRDGDAAVLQRFAVHTGVFFMSALTLAELERGLHENPALAVMRRLRTDSVIRHIPILAFDAAAGRAYGRIIVQCGWAKGRDYDRMIAAHAVSAGATLVTNNEADFSGIPNLVLENWVTV